MVVLVGHTGTYRRVRDDIHVVTNLVIGQDGGNRGVSVLAKLLRKEMAGATLVTVRMNHLYLQPIIKMQ